MIIGRLGLIYYIGPLLTDEEFSTAIATHIQDTSLGLNDTKAFKIDPRPIDRLEVNRIYQFCKGFEEQFQTEVKHLLEYKVQLTDRTTYYVDDDASQKEYECQFTFLAENKRAPLL